MTEPPSVGGGAPPPITYKVVGAVVTESNEDSEPQRATVTCPGSPASNRWSGGSRPGRLVLELTFSTSVPRVLSVLVNLCGLKCVFKFSKMLMCEE